MCDARGSMDSNQVGRLGGGGTLRVCVCKIYSSLSGNFDPKVVNLSEESSQRNRKQEEGG